MSSGGSEWRRPSATDPPVVVIGAGVSGLAAAWRLHRAGIPVTVLERRRRVGGVMNTVDVGGHVFERGPNTVISPEGHLLALIDELELSDRVIFGREAAHRRLIWRHGRMHDLPGGPGGLLGTSLLSWRGRARLLSEPFRSPLAEPRDETVAEFFGRRIGPEAVASFIDPMVSGIYAGDVDRLGADAFPKLMALEREHGSLVRGLMQSRKGGAPRPDRRLIGFRDGLSELPARLRERLGTRVRLDHDVREVRPGTDAPWEIFAMDDDRQARYPASGVVLAVPAWEAARLLAPVDAPLAGRLGAIPHAGIISVGLGYPRAQVERPIEAFGLLCASDSPLPQTGPVLGVLFGSSIFEGRAPDQDLTFTVMLGGARDPEALSLDDAALVDRARAALGVVVGARGAPTAVQVSRWPDAIPQIPPGHLRTVAALREGIAAWPGLALAGNYLDGVGVDSAIGAGFGAAALLAGPDVEVSA
ncbi:MAG: protoporphyrinogen oxidase [Deltaproteobacteria bacterium]|nr:protoporphyrinogen oxidase [Deltaproteobacteria bacterium]